MNTLHTELENVIKNTKIPLNRNIPQHDNETMKECDVLFQEYLTALKNNRENDNQIRELYESYQIKRKQLNRELFQQATQKYKTIIESNDSKKLWNLINWSGDIKKSKPHNHPPIEELSEHFSNLYEPINGDGDLQSLESNVYIPLTDDAITPAELDKACKHMKKGGYDFPIICLTLLMATLGSIILHLMNTILFTCFPTSLCIALMTAIPKAGNLRLTENYRGIQIQPMLANLYDRIICNRLIQWAKINIEQTAFQKGKGCIDQIFLLRVIISIILERGETLYVGFFDLSKAFDRVSRYLLLKQLVKLGIGSVMFCSIKSMYSVTRCVLRGFGKISEIFETHTGIKQGASSSVILFIIFLDNIIDDLKEKCIPEPILQDLHCLLHADDTLIISTNRESFIHKCNVLIKTLTDKKMLLNYKKSGYMIINGGEEDLKSALRIDSGWLLYKVAQKYLGVMFSDTGVLKTDISLFLEKKKKDVNVKLASFLNKNVTAPIPIKLKVVNSCINSALTYGCEAWGSSPLNNVEILQRKALKMILDVRRNTPNEIVYTESGHTTVQPMIYKRQLKFFHKVKEDCLNNPTSTIAKIFTLGIDTNTKFLRHYKELDEKFLTPEACFQFYVNQHKNKISAKIQIKYDNDVDSTLGTYKRINPTLVQPLLLRNICCHEIDRKIITRYRTGSHDLKIQSGRLTNTDRNDRKCPCGNVQTLKHLLFHCSRTLNIRRIHDVTENNLETFFDNTNYVRTATVLKAIEKAI